MKYITFWLIAFLLTAVASGRDIHVDHVAGDDAAAGTTDAPLQTVRRAIRLAQAGDVIHLTPHENQPIREVIEFYNRSGAPGQPITLDGHGAIVDGTEPLDPSNWTQVEPGLWRCANLYQRTNHGKHLDEGSIRAVVGRFFMVFDGRMNHMNRSMKGKSQPFKTPAELTDGEWTFVMDEVAFYIRTDGKRTLEDYRIALPLRVNGVAIYGPRCEHLVIRNLTLRRVYNDGFNIHGTTRDIRLENVAAIECGDDGISAHDDCHVDVDGFRSIGNSTGICHAGQSRTTLRRAVLRDNLGVDVYVFGTGQHDIRDTFVSADGNRSVVVEGSKDEPCTLTLQNVMIRRGRNEASIRVQSSGVLTMNRCTIDGLGLIANGHAVTLERCMVAGGGKAEFVIYPQTDFHGHGNVYDLRHLRIGPSFFTAQHAELYADSTGDADSTWLPTEATDVGFDMSTLDLKGAWTDPTP